MKKGCGSGLCEIFLWVMSLEENLNHLKVSSVGVCF